jgi:IS6 family transposase
VVDQHGQVIDVLGSERRDGQAARAFFTRAMRFGPAPIEVPTDRAPVYPARHRHARTDRPARARAVRRTTGIEAEHAGRKASLKPMRGLKRTNFARTIAGGHAIVQNLGRATTNSPPNCQPHDRVRVAVEQLATCL